MAPDPRQFLASFGDVPEVYFFRVREGRITRAWGLEDTAGRLRQLGLPPG